MWQAERSLTHLHVRFLPTGHGLEDPTLQLPAAPVLRAASLARGSSGGGAGGSSGRGPLPWERPMVPEEAAQVRRVGCIRYGFYIKTKCVYYRMCVVAA